MQGGTHTLNLRNSFRSFASSIFSIPEAELNQFQTSKLRIKQKIDFIRFAWSLIIKTYNFDTACKLETFLRLRFGLSSEAERFSTFRAMLLPSSMISIEFTAVPAEENEKSR